MQLTIDWLERKEWNGKELLDVKLQDGKKATIWKTQKDGSVFPGFDEIAPGHTIEGELWNKPGTDNWTIYPPKEQKRGGGSSGMRAAQDRKSEYIKEAQERKEESIAFFNATNAAIEMVKARSDFDHLDVETKQDSLIVWRDWFLAQWRKYDAKPETDKRIPF